MPAPEALSGGPLVGSARTSIAVEVADPALRDVLRRWLVADPGFRHGRTETADLVITDGEGDNHRASHGQRLLRVGRDGVGANVLSSLDPVVILSAARLIALGYRLEPDRASPGRDAQPAPRLSPRELQVAALLVDGAGNKAVARDLGISVHTVKFHVAAILDKLGAQNRADAVAIILREGLIAI